MAIWVAFAVLVAVAWAVAPSSLSASGIATMSPLVAVLTVAGVGQTLVVMTGGIDLSIPAVITMVGTVMLKVSGGTNDHFLKALLLVLALAVLVGFVNGFLVSVLGLNPLVVTLAVGQLVFGCTIWYRGLLLADTNVPNALASWASARVWDVNALAFVALGIVVVATIILVRTPVGRRFVATGTNQNAAWIAGVPVRTYVVCAYALAALASGIAGLFLSALIQTPTQDLGDPYLLPTVVIVVLGGALLTGGPASFFGTLGGALFITLLDFMLRVKGLSTGYSSLVGGIVLAVGVGLLGQLDRLLAIGSSLRVRRRDG